MNTSDVKSKIDGCVTVAEDFTRLYYGSLDTRRHNIGRLYIENATLSWNGNGIQGKSNIERLLQDLPKSRHNLTTLDAQPILEAAVGSQRTYLILAGGTVKLTGHQLINFKQSFILTVENDKWKIASDCYRLQE